MLRRRQICEWGEISSAFFHNPFLSLNLLLHIFHYSYHLLLKALPSFLFPCNLSFSLPLFSAAFSSGCKRTSHHKSAPLLLLRKENEEKRAGRGNTSDAGREKIRGKGVEEYLISEQELQSPMNRWIKWKEERGCLGGAEDVTINENNLQFRS